MGPIQQSAMTIVMILLVVGDAVSAFKQILIDSGGESWHRYFVVPSTHNNQI